MTESSNLTESIAPDAPDSKTMLTRSRTRIVLIGGGAVLAAAVLAGGGAAIGAAFADEADDDRETVSQDAQYTGGGDTTNAEGEAGVGDSGVVGSDSPADLLDIIETASAEADGNPIDMEAIGGGAWDVQFVTDSGDESEVRVHRDGTAVLVSTETADSDDRTPAGQLDTATVEALVTAALNEAAGVIVDLSIDANDTTAPYDVTVLTADRRTTDIAFDIEFTVFSTEFDTDDD